MAKRPSLAESMKSLQRQKPLPALPPAPGEERSAGEGRRYFAATRVGKKRITFPATEQDHRRLKRLAADSGRSIEDLMQEALTDLFEKLA